MIECVVCACVVLVRARTYRVCVYVHVCSVVPVYVTLVLLFLSQLLNGYVPGINWGNAHPAVISMGKQLLPCMLLCYVLLVCYWCVHAVGKSSPYLRDDYKEYSQQRSLTPERPESPIYSIAH